MISPGGGQQTFKLMVASVFALQCFSVLSLFISCCRFQCYGSRGSYHPCNILAAKLLGASRPDCSEDETSSYRRNRGPLATALSANHTVHRVVITLDNKAGGRGFETRRSPKGQGQGQMQKMYKLSFKVLMQQIRHDCIF